MIAPNIAWNYHEVDGKGCSSVVRPAYRLQTAHEVDWRWINRFGLRSLLKLQKEQSS